jgi:coatomer protein complex subunit gamma
MEIERTIEDNSFNSSIKAYGLSIFLKISKELSESRTEKMFKTFIEQYPKFKDEFKKKVIVISKGICQEIPDKQKIYFKFFCEIFKLDSGPQTKSEILDAILWFVYNNKELKNQAILFLAEMIFDCQYDVIKVKILSLLGKECLNANPAKLVRYIYNQIILETPMVRASAISALGEIAFKEPNLRKTILVLIKRSFNDSDAEVRERAFFYYKAINNLDNEDENLKNSKITNFVFPSFNEKENNFFNNLDVDIIQSILKVEKETLLNSENISDELTNILNNKEKVEEILIKNKKELEKMENKKDKKKIKKTKTKKKSQKMNTNKQCFQKFMEHQKLLQTTKN